MSIRVSATLAKRYQVALSREKQVQFDKMVGHIMRASFVKVIFYALTRIKRRKRVREKLNFEGDQ